MISKAIVCDVAVFGAGPSGLAAALAAARNGSKVVLVEKSGTLGGNLVSGLPLLGYLDKNGKQVTGGIAQEIIDKLIERGACLGHNRCALHNSVTIIDAEAMKMLAFELCEEAGVKVLLHCSPVAVRLHNKQIAGVEALGTGVRYHIEAKVFIDSTADGELACISGAAYEKGDEESGIMQPPTLLYMLMDFCEEEFLKYLEQHPKDLIPAESMNVSVGYDVPYFRGHPGYVFLGLRDTLAKHRLNGINALARDTLIYIKTTHPKQICVNATRVLNFDGSDSEELTRGTRESMRQIYAMHQWLKEHIPGFQNTYISYINDNIGVRETRRFHGIQRLTIDRVVAGQIPEDSIALGSYKVDIHSGTGEGTILTDLEQAYGIPLGCLISSDFENLMLNGRCISMDSPSLASVRVMPTCMAIGQGAGVCASLAVKGNCAPKDVAPRVVVETLLEDKAILSVD